MREAARKVRDLLMSTTLTKKNMLPHEVPWINKKLSKTQQQFSPLVKRYDLT